MARQKNAAALLSIPIRSERERMLSLFESAGEEPVAKARPISPLRRAALERIQRLDAELSHRFSGKFLVDPQLSRQMVSFQANKGRAVYRWCKYKEAFSAALVEHLLSRYGVRTGKILDPFAGSGTALFAASALGIDADGIELLPMGREIIDAKQILGSEFGLGDFDALQRWMRTRPWEKEETREPLPELRITRGAYPEQTRDSIERYLAACRREKEQVRRILLFALLCVLESVSYTRKDGQYLRWDHRSGRRQGARPFDKGHILPFEQAISKKIEEISVDAQAMKAGLGLLPGAATPGGIRFWGGSCLDVLPTLPADAYAAVMTSPPYCNRYDYTRTYALELALLGTGETALTELRQNMLSCTVENRAKDLPGLNPSWRRAMDAADGQALLRSILAYLEEQKADGALNNNGIPRMVRGYFHEMACVIAECGRVLKPDGLFFMVNDNVRYAGASISVDMILSDIAAGLGFSTENILVLPNGKGNSSQQMGEHGREALRKCVYVWRKR